MRATLLCSLLTLVLASSCDGPCKYRSVTGTCMITQIGGREGTTFSFTADGETSASGTGTLANVHLVNGPSGQEPSPECLQSNHIGLGTKLACTHQIETFGTCAPQFFL